MVHEIGENLVLVRERGNRAVRNVSENRQIVEASDSWNACRL
jgi:hypothetical protein